MVVGILKEIFSGERRVALVPDLVPGLVEAELSVVVEAGAGARAGFPDTPYREQGAEIVRSRAKVLGRADILLQVRTGGAGRIDLDGMRPGQIAIGFAEPLTDRASIQALSDAGITLFAVDLMPRITRAQAMDALSSQATVAGYKAALLAAEELPRMFPLMMTAAGTLTPARVLVIGAGVAGLQAIATARRLGAVVSAYDVRASVGEQVESLGARFVDLGLEARDAEDRGGYAKVQDDVFQKRQQAALGEVVADSDVVIATAAVPGKTAPLLMTSEMVARMAPGSVVVDLAAERGGNCAMTRPGETVVEGGVTILGPVNLPATVPYHASQMYARNLTAFFFHLIQEGIPDVRLEDEIVRETLVARGGEIVHPRVQEALGLACQT